MRPGLTAPLLWWVCACVDSSQLPAPSAPTGSRASVWVRSCGGVLSARVDHAGAILPAVSEACELPLVYYLLHLSVGLESLGVRPGRLELEPCPQRPEPCCADAALPLPQRLALHAAQREDGSGTLEFAPLETVPAELASLRFRRGCECPALRYQVIEVPLSLNYRRLRVVGAGDGRVAIAAHFVHPSERPELQRAVLYRSTVESLRADGLPTESSTSAPGREWMSLAWAEGGTLFGGRFREQQLHEGREDGTWEAYALPATPASPELLAYQARDAAPGRLAVAGWFAPGRVHLRVDGAWQSSDESSLMRGTCARPRDRPEQTSALLWSGTDELVFMPHSADRATRPASDAKTAPDGFFRRRGGVTEWVQVERREDECLSGVVYVPDVGLIVSSHGGRFYWESSGGWEELTLARHPSAQSLPLRTQAMVPVRRGFAFGHTQGGFGVVRAGVLCQHEVLGRTSIDSMSWAGATLVATGERDQIGNRLAIYLIELDDGAPD